MIDQRRQSNEAQADSIPEALQRNIREFHLAMKRVALYPSGHPARVKAASRVSESFQQLLTSQDSHSLAAVGNKLYIDQHRATANGQHQGYVASEGMFAELARNLRQHGIRSVTFSRGIQLQELDRFLGIMTMNAREVMAQGGAGELLRSASDVSHIEIVDIEYEDIQVVTGDGEEDSMDVERILASYLKGQGGSLADGAYTYLLSLLDKPDMMARLIQDSADYDDISESGSTTMIRSMENLIGLEEQLTEEERKEFRKKILEAALQMERPAKKMVFDMSEDGSILARLMDGLSVDEIARLMAQESATDESPVVLSKMLDEFLASNQADASELFAEQLAEVETAIQDELAQKGQEDTYNNTFAQVLEEAFVALEVEALGDEQSELERLLDESYSQEQEQTEHSAEEMMDLFAGEDDVINSVLILLEMLESETDSEDYSDIVDQLEGRVRSLTMELQDTMDVRDQYLTMVFYITDALSEHAHHKSDKPLELRERAGKALVNIGTEEIMGQIISSSLRAEQLDWSALERFIQQMGEKVIPLLGENLLEVETDNRRGLGDILVSMGPMVVSELGGLLSQSQSDAVSKDIMTILSKIGGDEALDCIADALNHPNSEVRRLAVIALAASDSPKMPGLILNRVRDEEEEESIRQLAISLLVETGNEQVAEEMERMIKGKNAVLKREAVYALGSIGSEKSISILSDLLKQRRLILGRRRIEKLQLDAVAALSQIGTQSAIEVLQEISQKKKGNLKSACDRALQSHLGFAECEEETRI